ncbi:uncharacterized protein LOC134786344 isoform X2 [Penaeus indicus]|uniref:uncharacterized protein LOC134786344 isoform X2 n=1 Tax=Penaeus indicus TaxID=29960 RepID=UPI00300C10F1
MPVTCAAENCSNIYQRGNNITFHCFPKNKVLREEWVKATHRKDWKPTQYSKLCSDHFLLSDFRLFTNRRELMCSAVPSIFGHTRPDQKITSKHKQTGESLQMKEPTVTLKKTDSDCSTVRKQRKVQEKRKRRKRRKRGRWDPGKDDVCELGDRHIEHSYARPLKAKGKTGIIFMDTTLGRRRQLAILTTFNVPKCHKEVENDLSTDTASEDGMAPCTPNADHDQDETMDQDQIQATPSSKLGSNPGDSEEWETVTSPKLDNTHDHEDGETPPTSNLDDYHDKNEKGETLPISLNLENDHNDEKTALTSPKTDDLCSNEEEGESLCAFSVSGRSRNTTEIKMDHLHDQEDRLAQELLQLPASSPSLMNINNREEEEIEEKGEGEEEEKCKNLSLKDADIEVIQEYIQKAIQVAQDKDPDLDRSSHFAMSLTKVMELYTDLLKCRKSEEQFFTYFRPIKVSPPSHCTEDEENCRDSSLHSKEESKPQELQQVSDQDQDVKNKQTINHNSKAITIKEGINLCEIKEEKKEVIEDEYCMSIKEEPLFDEHEYLSSIESIQEQMKEEVCVDFMQGFLLQRVDHECNIGDVNENSSSSFQDFESCVEDLPGGLTSY